MYLFIYLSVCVWFGAWASVLAFLFVVMLSVYSSVPPIQWIGTMTHLQVRIAALFYMLRSFTITQMLSQFFFFGAECDWLRHSSRRSTNCQLYCWMFCNPFIAHASSFLCLPKESERERVKIDGGTNININVCRHMWCSSIMVLYAVNVRIKQYIFQVFQVDNLFLFCVFSFPFAMDFDGGCSILHKMLRCVRTHNVSTDTQNESVRHNTNVLL